MQFIETLETKFQQNSNLETARAMSKYMRNHFDFFGIKTEKRRHIFKTICQEYKEEISGNSREIAWRLYTKDQREMHYCAIEILTHKLKGNFKKNDIQLIEK